MNPRELRGMEMLSNGDTPKVVDEETFIVPSQTNGNKYSVKHLEAWTCTCPDYLHRGVVCKHIALTQMWLKLRNRLDTDNGVMELEEEITGKGCPKCKSRNVVKNGNRKTKAGEVRQRFLCRDCGKRFVFEPLRTTEVKPQMVALTIDLYFKGLSLRDIEDTIYQFYGMKVDYSTISKWITHYTEKMNTYVKKQSIKKVSKKWKADEQMVKAGGKWFWSWNILDPETKYLLGSHLSKKRESKEATDTLKGVTKWTGVQPSEIVTDGAFAYGKAIKKAYPDWWRKESKVTHRRYKSITDRRMNNNDIERYHSTFREFDKVRRGFEKQHTAQANVDAFRTYYNFIRTHTTLGTTPAQEAGIELNLGRNKWLGLLEKSLTG